MTDQESHQIESTAHNPPGRGFWLLMLVALTGVGAVAFLQYSRVDQARRGHATPIAATTALPVIAELPEFSLVERGGKKITRGTLAGHVWIADFFFTHCAGPCPVMSRRMKELQQALKDANHPEVLCVSISVDPQRDTKEVLQEYAKGYQADDSKWLFLTGEKRPIRRLAINGFKLSAEDTDEEQEQVLHSTRFALVDQKGRIRGYYKALLPAEEEDVNVAPAVNGLPADVKSKILADIATLLREPQ